MSNIITIDSAKSDASILVEGQQHDTDTIVGGEPRDGDSLVIDQQQGGDTSGPEGGEQTGGEQQQENGAESDGETQMIGTPETFDVPANLMLGALACTSADETRYYLNGVYVHAVEDRVRVVGTDGHRLFIGAFEPVSVQDRPLPAWLQRGIIIRAENLGAKLKFAAKLSGAPFINLSYADGASHVQIEDMAGEASFRCQLIDGTFPDYQLMLDQLNGGIDFSNDPAKSDWTPISFNGKLMKSLLDVAVAVTGEKEPVVQLYQGGEADPTVLTFPQMAGAMALLMPMRIAPTLSGETGKLLSGATKGTLAALRAHMTRNEQVAETTADPAEKAKAEAKVADYKRRIADLLAKTTEVPALEGPEKSADIVQFPGGEVLSSGDDTVTGGDIVDGQPLGTDGTDTVTGGGTDGATDGQDGERTDGDDTIAGGEGDQQPSTAELESEGQGSLQLETGATGEQPSEPAGETSEAPAAKPLSKRQRRQAERKARELVAAE